MSDTIEEQAAKFATLNTEVKNLQTSFDRFGKESGENFVRIFEKLERVNAPKETPWGHIFAGIGVLVTILGGMVGAGLTLVIALAAWANAYFGEMIAKSDSKAEAALTMRDTVSGLTAGRQADEKELSRLMTRLDSIERRAESTGAKSASSP